MSIMDDEFVPISPGHLREVDAVQNKIRLAADLLPPVPALLLGTVIFALRRRREYESIPSARKRGAA